MAKLLDTQSFDYVDIDDLYEEVMIIYDHFEKLFKANGCQCDLLKSELRVLVKHVNTFLSKVPAANCWPRIFKAKDSLNILNILHLVELSIAFPFSFLWRLYTKERLSLGNDTIEALLRLRGDSDFTVSNYDRVIKMFLSHNPDGTLRPGKRHVVGHNYPSKRKSKNSVTAQHLLVEINEILAKVTDIDINDISDDDWSDDSDDEN